MQKEKLPKINIQRILKLIAAGILILSSILLFVIYSPIITQEIDYFLSRNDYLKSTENNDSNEVGIIPVDTLYGIVVPKINANAKIIADVNPLDSSEYQLALSHGIAHAKGTSYPNQLGNVFLFAHSSDNFYNANRYNSIFYLLHKLEEGDEFSLWYDNIEYKYKIYKKEVVNANQVEYMEIQEYPYTATLMTCWPPGTTLKRLVVVGKLE